MLGNIINFYYKGFERKYWIFGFFNFGIVNKCEDKVK